MRTIKFRAFYKDNMVYCDLNIGFSHEGYKVYQDIIKNKIELMQYTGLKDINGVEIFEGDIVKGIDGWEDNKGRDSNNYLPKIYSVKWEGSELVPMSQDGEYLHFKSYWWEVIGNVYENGEIIKSS